MLDQRSTLAYIENLKAPANCEYRKILRERLFQQQLLDSVALRVGRFRFRLLRFTVERGVDVRSAGEDQPRRIAEQQRASSLTHQRIESGRKQRIPIRRYSVSFPVYYEDLFAHESPLSHFQWGRMPSCARVVNPRSLRRSAIGAQVANRPRTFR